MEDILATMKVIRTGSYALIKKGNEILLELQTEGPYAGKWDLPGVKIDCGEKPEEAIDRLFEEKLHGSYETSELKHAWTATFEQPQFMLHQIALIYEIEGYQGMASGWTDLNKISEDQLTPLALNAKLIK